MSQAATRHEIFEGDTLDFLRTLPDASVHCCCTSPPYWGLRDYGHAGQIGLEDTPEAYVARMVEVFREVRRVLRHDGTLWLNLGDSYNNAGSSKNGTGLDGKQRGGATGADGECGYKKRDLRHALKGIGIKHKDLVGIPWRVAFAMQADGWYLRQDCIWHKPNPMPESVRDRCTKSHEYVFLLSKSSSYYFDAEAISEPVAASTVHRLQQPKLLQQAGSNRVPGKTNGSMKAAPPRFGGSKFGDSDDPKHRTKSGNAYQLPEGGRRNRRSVWTVTTKPYKGAHFDTMPPDLAELCILAGTSEEGCCSDCGRPWARQVSRERVATRPGADTKVTGDTMTDGNRDPLRHVTTTSTVGWAPGCTCGAGVAPCLVLDPFAGSGTTLAVAARLGREAIGAELNPDYIRLAEDRIAKERRASPLFA